MINWSRVAELRDEIGAEDFDEVVELFMDEVGEAITTLGDGSEPLERQLHFLKGSALNIGFDAFSSLCQAGETAARDGQGDSIDLNTVKTCYSESKALFLKDLSTRFA